MKDGIGCLIIHGFAGNLGEIEPLNRYLSSKGFVTQCPILKGHMGSRQDLAVAKYTQWIESAENSLLELNSRCNKIIIIGFSMGGLIAVNLAAKYKTYGIVTLNTPIYHWDIKRIVKNVANDIKTKDYKHIKYYIGSATSIPFSSMINFKVLLGKTKPLLKNIRCPIFIAQGLIDDTVHHKSADYIYKNVSSKVKYVKYYENSNHIICHSIDSKDVFTDIENFIENINF
ncbi:alpha/beta hydrolase [Acetivibrio straminisolvens]|jgi:carboxylesterase|nr:alpha/beta fold hydrolase [Acetivibrio straminisolvens]